MPLPAKYVEANKTTVVDTPNILDCDLDFLAGAARTKPLICPSR